jgi:hypothetical protein
MGLSDARPLLPLEFSRAWLGKVEEVRRAATSWRRRAGWTA